MDYSSIFNSIIPSRLISKMSHLGFDNICLWIKDFLKDRLQAFRIGPPALSFVYLQWITSTPLAAYRRLPAA